MTKLEKLSKGKEEDASSTYLIERDKEREVLILELRPFGRKRDLRGQVHRVDGKKLGSFLRVDVVFGESDSFGFREILNVERFGPAGPSQGQITIVEGAVREDHLHQSIGLLNLLCENGALSDEKLARRSVDLVLPPRPLDAD